MLAYTRYMRAHIRWYMLVSESTSMLVYTRPHAHLYVLILLHTRAHTMRKELAAITVQLLVIASGQLLVLQQLQGHTYICVLILV